MYILCIYEKNIVLSLFKIDALNFTMHILTILTWSLKTYAFDCIVGNCVRFQQKNHGKSHEILLSVDEIPLLLHLASFYHFRVVSI